MAFLVVFVVGICSRTRSLAFSGSRSRFWLLLMLQAIHHFRSNFFKRRYGSKITAPNYTQKIFPTTTHFWVITPVPPVLLSNRKVLIHVHSSCKVSSYKKIFEIINSFFFSYTHSVSQRQKWWMEFEIWGANFEIILLTLKHSLESITR